MVVTSEALVAMSAKRLAEPKRFQSTFEGLRERTA